MAIENFPPLELADENGFLCVGGDLEVESLLLAYRSGIFLWPFDDQHLTWFAPPKRSVLFFDELHISKSLKKFERQNRDRITYTINERFREVITKCSELKNRGEQKGTWIIPQMIDGYTKLFEEGYAISVETYYDGELVGGIYGVYIEKMFAGESMFYRETNGSKLALLKCIEYLKERGTTWLDCQMTTPLLASFGAREITRDEFMTLLRKSL